MEFIVYVKKSRATSSETSKSVAKGGTGWVTEFRTALRKNVKKNLLRFHVLQSIYMAADSKERNKYLFSWMYVPSLLFHLYLNSPRAQVEEMHHLL